LEQHAALSAIIVNESDHVVRQCRILLQRAGKLRSSVASPDDDRTRRLSTQLSTTCEMRHKARSDPTPRHEQQR
jgi:hypothetical protein